MFPFPGRLALATLRETSLPHGRQVDFVLPQNSAGHWLLVTATASAPEPWWAKLEIVDPAGGIILREAFLGKGRRRRSAILHVPSEAGGMRLLVLGGPVTGLRLQAAALGRISAALHLLREGWRHLPEAWRGSGFGRSGRIRATLAWAAARRGDPPPYLVWVGLFDRPPPAHATHPACIEIGLLGTDPAWLAATTISLRAQTFQPVRILEIAHASDWSRLRGPWTAIAQAGESFAPWALACLAQAAAADPQAGWICADTDQVDAAGLRHTPCFKPTPDPLLLRSGRLTTGLCLFRNDGGWPALPLDADRARLALAEFTGGRDGRRVPRILTHCRHPSPCHPPPTAPAQGRLPRISLIIPSACRSAHVPACIAAVLARTDYPDFEVLVAISKVSPDDRRQAAIIRRVRALGNTVLLDLGREDFNYAEVNNLAAASATGEWLLLLNDDVAPISPGWLRAMAQPMSDPAVGAVGARLLYGNGRVQHAGVVLGLANLCEHSAKLQPGSASGLAKLDREVSAVTGACLLVRAELFATLRMDEDFAIALNDVDFCLRLRQTGARVVYAPGAELYHYESLSLGRHYLGPRSALQAAETGRLRASWPAVITDDPYYNPQASVEPGREWQPAFPPRNHGKTLAED